MKVLITGGAGYIGSTVATACLEAGITPVLLDNLATGSAPFTEGRLFHRGDLGDAAALDRVLDAHPDITAAVHCAARIVVPESITDPLGYYTANVAKPLVLADALVRHGVTRLLFSSTAALYAPGPDGSVTEESAPDPRSPYARSKLMLEQILADTAAATPLRVLSLRYFNPIGADPGLRTGLANPAPSHALGRLVQAYEKGEPYVLTGTDWPTRDGSAIRDYLHVWDLAAAHTAALARFDDLLTADRPHDVVNLGTGTGTTVRELIAAFEEVTGAPLPVVDAPRRDGDTVGCFTRVGKARRLLGWRAEHTLADGIRDALAWSARRPAVLGA